jgi:hypothetical protein
MEKWWWVKSVDRRISGAAGFVQKCRQTIDKIDKKYLLKPPWPLLHINRYLSCPDDDRSIAPCVADLDIENVSLPEDPSFKELTEEILLYLRMSIYQGCVDDINDRWSEKLMRFCEIRFHELEKISTKKCGNKSSAKLHMLHCTAYLIDKAIFAKDIRLVNTVMKLCDLKWLFDGSIYRGKIGSKEHDIKAGLFQFRIIVLLDYTLKKLRQDACL